MGAKSQLKEKNRQSEKLSEIKFSSTLQQKFEQVNQQLIHKSF